MIELIGLVLPAVAGALTWVLAKAGQWLRGRVRFELAQHLLERLEMAVAASVRSIEQTIVRAIREASSDGRISAQERARLRATALAAVKRELGADALRRLGQTLCLSPDAVDDVISHRIEASVLELRRANHMKPVDWQKTAQALA